MHIRERGRKCSQEFAASTRRLEIIKNLPAEGLTLAQIGKRLGISNQRVSQLLRGE
jgi:DNA-directed RNA polymerase specialized sigma subunit